jgi:hypothetical protein
MARVHAPAVESMPAKKQRSSLLRRVAAAALVAAAAALVAGRGATAEDAAASSSSSSSSSSSMTMPSQPTAMEAQTQQQQQQSSQMQMSQMDASTNNNNNPYACNPSKNKPVSSEFVKTAGTKFTLGGKPWYFGGTNAVYLINGPDFPEADIPEFFCVQANQGARVVRLAAYLNGFGCRECTKTPNPIQPRVGVFNEATLQRLDKMIAAAKSNGIRLIMTLGNFEDQWGREEFFSFSSSSFFFPSHLFYFSSLLPRSLVLLLYCIVSTFKSNTNQL